MVYFFAKSHKILEFKDSEGQNTLDKPWSQLATIFIAYSNYPPSPTRPPYSAIARTKRWVQ